MEADAEVKRGGGELDGHHSISDGAAQMEPMCYDSETEDLGMDFG